METNYKPTYDELLEELQAREAMFKELLSQHRELGVKYDNMEYWNWLSVTSLAIVLASSFSYLYMCMNF